MKTLNHPPPDFLLDGTQLNSVPSAKPRLGFLGLGWIGLNRLQSLQQQNIAQIAAVADTQTELVEKAVQSVSTAQKAQDLEDLLKLDLDGVVIATPSALHAQQTYRCLKHGLPVFCQKPLGRTGDETRVIVQTARDRDLLLGVDFSYRYISAIRKVHELCRAGELGQIYAVELTFHNAYGPDRPWFYDWKKSGGGCVIDLGIHLVDLGLWNLGFPKVTNVSSRLYAQGAPIKGRYNTVEDYAEIRLDLETGTTIRITCSWRVSAGCDAVITGSLYGTQGGAIFQNLQGSFFDFASYHCRGTRREMLWDTPEPWGGKALLDWTQQLTTSNRFREEAEQLIQVAEVVDAIYANSIPGGRR